MDDAAQHNAGQVRDLSDIKAVDDYLRRIGAEVRSMLTAVVRENRGQYWADLAVIKLDKVTGEITVKPSHDVTPDAYLPTDTEATVIKAACAGVNWPHSITAARRPNCLEGLPLSLPPELEGVDEENIFAFHSEDDGRVVMLQQRATKEEEAAGKPKYRPFSFWSDHRWRQMEPEGPLPLWGIDQLKDNTTFFLHEGAKAARAVRRMVEIHNGIRSATDEEKAEAARHPWIEELGGAAHIGWIGGAMSPERTDWSVLKKMGVTRAYIVSDNDEPGREATPKLARRLHVPTFNIQFTKDWPVSFDLDDPFPEKMFKTDENDQRRYVGPSFHAMREPATWATDLIPNPGGGKPVPVLREHFKSMWVYADEPEMFVCTDDTRIVCSADNLSRRLMKFSDSPGTARLLLKVCEHVTSIAYAPDKKDGTAVTVRGRRMFNVFRPSGIKPKAGDAGPWLEFLAYLFPDADEREAVERWIATLVALPERRILYGLLLVSTVHGVGKGILARHVLAPLVGHHNVGFPSEHDITESGFNEWKAHKRLVVVDEIYQGHSFKAYNRLKSVITDIEFDVNRKHEKAYKTDNWCHVIAMSNSRKALKVEEHDRRWFYPNVTERKWPREKFAAFIEWLSGGGLEVIAHWAHGYGNHVLTGEEPPMTANKAELIEGSRDEELSWVREYCAGRIADGESFVISTDVAFDHVKMLTRKANIFSTKHDLGREMAAVGMIPLTGDENRVKYETKRHNLVLSPAAEQDLIRAVKEGFPEQEEAGDSMKLRRNAWLREQLMKTQEALRKEMTL